MNKIKTISIKLVLPLAILLSYVIVFSIGYNVGWIQAGQECLFTDAGFSECHPPTT